MKTSSPCTIGDDDDNPSTQRSLVGINSTNAHRTVHTLSSEQFRLWFWFSKASRRMLSHDRSTDNCDRGKVTEKLKVKEKIETKRNYTFDVKWDVEYLEWVFVFSCFWFFRATHWLKRLCELKVVGESGECENCEKLFQVFFLFKSSRACGMCSQRWAEDIRLRADALASFHWMKNGPEMSEKSMTNFDLTFSFHSSRTDDWQKFF